MLTLFFKYTLYSLLYSARDLNFAAQKLNIAPINNNIPAEPKLA